MGETRPAARPAWAEAYDLWVGAGRGNAAGFLALTKPARVELLGYDGPMPSPAELAAYDARAFWIEHGGEGGAFDALAPAQRAELLGAFGG